MSCEEKLEQRRQLLPRLREAVRKDVRVPVVVPEVSQEKLQAEIYHKINTCNMLEHQLRQRRQARDRLQRQLQQLQDIERQEKRDQMQAIHQLQNNIEKVNMKVQAAQKLTAVYLELRDALKKELAHLQSHLDLLSEMNNIYQQQNKDWEGMASEAVKAADTAKEDMAKMEKTFLEESKFRYQLLTAQAVNMTTNRHWLKEAREKRGQASSKLFGDLRAGLTPEDSSGDEDDKKEATQQDSTWITEKTEEAKTAVQCSCIWDIPIMLLAQHKSSVYLQQHIKMLKEKEQALKEALKEQELKHTKIKFHKPSNTNRKLEEEMRGYLQVEEARLEQMRARMNKSQELLLQFENRIDGIFARLRGITVPGQDDAIKTMRAEERLRHCKQKLQYLVQLVSDLDPGSYSANEEKKTFMQVISWLEKTTANDERNLKISFRDVNGITHDISDLFEKGRGDVPTRESIKKQGMQLTEMMKKSGKKK